MAAIPIGDQLREARERKGLELDQIAGETNISRRYLAALESEDFSVFPGDPYVIGFLRNYGEYLGLVPDELVLAYKNMKIQEQPIPIQELISSPKRSPLPFIIGGIALAALIIFLAVKAFLPSASSPSAPVLEGRGPVEYRMEASPLEKRFFEGDSILVALNGEVYKLVVSSISDRVSVDTPTGSGRYMLGEEGAIDLDKNNVPELKVFVADFSRGEPAKGGLLRFEFVSSEAAAQAAVAAQAVAAEAAAAQAGAPAAETAQAPAPVVAAPAAGAEKDKGTVLVEAGKSPYPFVMLVTFRSYSLFRYEVDRRDRDERYYHKGETITASANNGIKLWASNAASCKITIQTSGGNTVDLDIGGPGEVAVKQIKWLQAESGNWVLSVFDVD